MTVNKPCDRDKEGVRAAALEMGFSACGFADAEGLALGPVLAEWLAAGRHGHMEYLARPGRARIEPRMALAGARTVIVVARNYPAPPPPDPDWRAKLTGRVAAYAAGRDYHDSMAEALQTLASTVAGLSGMDCRVQVDSGPLVEKELARKAGLGWYGRNTNILAKPAGSYLLFGCLLTEAEISPDPPFEEGHCGQCTDCIAACPTAALGQGPTIDAPRCISYLTIEHRGPIARDLRPGIGNWVFGCDVCQEVCPWNDDAPRADDPMLSPYLPDMLAMSAERCHELYRSTAMWRAKRRGLARNAAVALGNSGNPEAVEPLAQALSSHDEPLVRVHAAWALGRIGGPAALRTLESTLAREGVPPVRAEIGLALAGRVPQARLSQ
ncbi:MAG: tRNA epoxyqueuosine(34) reductase QueG [Deltaproteobacteria bacterium]